MLTLLALAAPTATAATLGGDAAAAATSAGTRVRSALLAELNRVRADAHLAALRLDGRMNAAAAAYSGHMARSRRVGHGDWSTRVARSASAPSATGEVIGWLGTEAPQAEAAAVVQAWLDSPAHRNVLLDSDFRRVGIGRAVGSFGGIASAIYTVDFASAR